MELAEILKGVVGACEANSFERHCLWKEYTERGEPWAEAREGIGITIGHAAGMPVCVSLLVDTVRGHRVLMWHATSQVVDYRLIDWWLNEHLPNLPHVDAMNFHNVFPRKAQAA